MRGRRSDESWGAREIGGAVHLSDVVAYDSLMAEQSRCTLA